MLSELQKGVENTAEQLPFPQKAISLHLESKTYFPTFRWHFFIFPAHPELAYYILLFLCSASFQGLSTAED